MPIRIRPAHRRLILAGLAIMVIAGGGFVFWKHYHSRSTVSNTVDPATGQPTSPASKNSAAKGSGSDSQQTKVTSPATTAASSSLTAPQGQASHTIISKSAKDDAENSPNLEVTCLTASSNSCVVRLTSPSGQISTINNTYDDHNGNLIFDWNAKDYQVGSWKMELVASKSGQEATTNIGPLEVTP